MPDTPPRVSPVSERSIRHDPTDGVRTGDLLGARRIGASLARLLQSALLLVGTGCRS